MPDHPPLKRAIIDGLCYADGRQGAVVVIDGKPVFTTRLYRHPDKDGVVPSLRALREAKRWLANRDA